MLVGSVMFKNPLALHIEHLNCSMMRELFAQALVMLESLLEGVDVEGVRMLYKKFHISMLFFSPLPAQRA